MKNLIILAFTIAIFAVRISAQDCPPFCESGNGYIMEVYGFSQILYDDSQPQLVAGIAGTELTFYDGYPDLYSEDFDPWTLSGLYRTDMNEEPLSEGTITGFRDIIPADGYHPTFYATGGKTYCVYSTHAYYHYVWTGYGWTSRRRIVGRTQSCHLFPVPPTPTPTPCDGNSLVDCPSPTPTPTPTPTPQASISPVDLVEKNETAETTVNVTNAGNQTTTFSLRTTAGTGAATFDDGTTSKSFTGNVSNQKLTIKGVTESSQIDNIVIEAKSGGNLLVSDNFTVAVITNLTLAANNSPLDANPGTDGIANSDGSEGRRVFPDKEAPVDPTDRQTVKIQAAVAPSGLNAKIYLATFDLDDPSANAAPIDPNASVGADNNGTVTGGTGAGLLTGANCQAALTDQADCSFTGSNAEALLKVTMQPGDNFAVAASLTPSYRSGIKLDPNDGAKLLDAANSELPQIRQAGNNVVGIRTEMLTVWRRLHIEVDSMGNVNSNFVRGTLTDSKKVGTGYQTLNLSLTNLETNRFENGRLVITHGSIVKSLRVIQATATTAANTASSVTVLNNVSSFSISNGDLFTLYDDDDMNNNNGTNLDGDDGEDVPEPDMSLLQDNDLPSSNILVPAYIRPKYDVVDPRDNSYFQGNSYTATEAECRSMFLDRDLPTSTDTDVGFWSVYVLGAYQGAVEQDQDPEADSALFGIADGIPNFHPEGSGVSIFLELHNQREIAGYPSSSASLARLANTVGHEVGHLMGGIHGDGGLMGTLDRFGNTTVVSAVYDPTTIERIRIIKHP